MLIIPAIDLHRGRCVRLYQGDPERETIYGENPVEVALQWEQLGAKMLHLVDLDGAFTGFSKNAELIRAIGDSVQVPLQLGGGIRTKEAAEKAFSIGISRVILGTMVIENPEIARDLAVEHGEAIIVGIDARDGNVAVKGWKESSAVSVLNLAGQIEEWGVKEIVYTDINRDGTLKGPDFKGLEAIIAATSLQVIVSGGVSSVADLEAIRPYGERIKGVIIGKALYSNQLTLPDAMAVFN
jgi:phosphoribosylformimino-5-aminoimidazole carboxamide ribotide isomerase